jgi:endonuclease/exonuclease/phosphatase family metal-dependent hydrolase
METNHKDLKIAFWNAQSIQNKSVEVNDFIKDNNYDLFLVSESWLKSHIKYTVNADYNVYRLDRPDDKRSGGVMIIIKKIIKHKVLEIPPTKVVEVIGISVFTKNGELKIYSAYFPGSREKATKEKYRDDIKLLANQNCSYIIAGDMNSRHRSWNCLKANPAGTILFNEQNQGNFVVIYPDSHTYTYIPHNSKLKPSTIDIVLTNCFHELSHLETLNELFSDHRPVQFSINIETKKSNPDFHIYSYKKADWTKFRQYLNDSVNIDKIRSLEINDKDQIKNLIVDFSDLLINAIKYSIPLVKPYNSEFELSEEIKAMIIVRNMKRRQFQRTRNPALKNNINALQRKISSKISELKNKKFEFTIQESQLNDPKMWKITKFMKNKHRFHSISKNLPSCNQTEKDVKKSIDSCNSKTIPFNSIEYCSVNEIAILIKKLKRSMSPSFDISIIVI